MERKALQNGAIDFHRCCALPKFSTVNRHDRITFVECMLTFQDVFPCVCEKMRCEPSPFIAKRASKPFRFSYLEEAGD